MKRCQIPPHLALGLAVSLAAWGCAGGGDGEPSQDAGNLSGGSGGHALPSPDEFSLGVTTMGDQETFQVRVDGAEPAPPSKYENDWVVTVLDADGEPAQGVELFKVEPFMPAHGHDGTFEPTVMPGDEPGSFRVDRINLWMGGIWDVRFFLREGEAEDRVVISVFIED